MANENEWVFGAEVVLESSGASVANAAFAAATDSVWGSAQHSFYPFADFSFMTSGLGTTVASTGSLGLALWRRDINVNDDSSADEGAPTALNKAHFCGWATLPNSASSAAIHYMAINDVPLTGRDAEFYLENQSSVTIPAGWTLKVRPKTNAPGA